LDFCKGIGLLDSVGNKLTLPVSGSLSQDCEIGDLAAAMRPLLLAEPPETLWNTSERGKDVVRGIAWFCMQDAWTGAFSWDGANGVEDLQSHEFAGEPVDWVIKNKIQWRYFVRWSTFLGFGAGNSGAVMLDVTPLVLMTIEESELDLRAWVPFVDVREDISKRLPTLDGGALSNAVAGRMTEGALHLSEGRVSPALSFALLSLADAGTLEFEELADSTVQRYQLTDPDAADGGQWLSHIKMRASS
jgi:hypothetical protein